MNINEIVKALRGTCDKCNPTPCCEFEVLGDEAAKLIETLQLRIVELESREQEAVKCINDIETYLELGSPKFIKRTIDKWRGTKYTEEGVKE